MIFFNMNIIFKNYLDTSKPGPVMQYLTKKKIYSGFLFNSYNKILKVFIIFNFC